MPSGRPPEERGHITERVNERHRTAGDGPMCTDRTSGARIVISRTWLIWLAAASVVHPTFAAGEEAGALLAAGKAAEAADAARKCAEPRCGLVLGRALFALGQLGAAAAALGAARPGLGGLEAHAAQLE